jgi:2-keto-4-pentenoate hydratase
LRPCKCSFISWSYLEAERSRTPIHPLTAITDLRLIGVLLWNDGRIIDTGIGANTMRAPLSAVAWLANCFGEVGKVLVEGSIVLTGGLTQAHPVSEGGTFVAEFGSLGTVKTHFSKDE